MKLTPWYLAALAPIAIAGCSGALMGQLAVLAVAVGIFVGTLSLGRHQTTSSTVTEARAGELEPPAAEVSVLSPLESIDNA